MRSITGAFHGLPEILTGDRPVKCVHAQSTCVNSTAQPGGRPAFVWSSLRVNQPCTCLFCTLSTSSVDTCVPLEETPTLHASAVVQTNEDATQHRDDPVVTLMVNAESGLTINSGRQYDDKARTNATSATAGVDRRSCSSVRMAKDHESSPPELAARIDRQDWPPGGPGANVPAKFTREGSNGACPLASTKLTRVSRRGAPWAG